MSALTPLALTFADILRHLATSDADQTHAVVAKATGRDTSNTRRDMGKLAEAGLIVGMGGDPTRYILTNAGGRALDALDRAEGNGRPIAGLPTWPLDGFRRNPDQPRKHFPDEMIADRAESIVQVGGLLHPLVVDPADASGVRMIQDGECRWRAAQLLAQEGRLPEALQSGLPYTERAAGEAEMLKVALIANAQRSDLTPWEDAQGLKRLKDLLGLSARGVALAIGRAKEGSERGVKDVQEKIATAEKASAEDIALHESGEKTWEWLRESIREARALSPHAAFALVELRWRLSNDRIFRQDRAWVIDNGRGDDSLSWRELRAANLVENIVVQVDGVTLSLSRVTETGQTWLNKTYRDRLDEIANGAMSKPELAVMAADAGALEASGLGDDGFLTPWLNAAAKKAQLKRARDGELAEEAAPSDQLDIEEAIASTTPRADPVGEEDPGNWRFGDDHDAWVRKKLRHALGSIKPRDLLAVVELADACHFKPYGAEHPGYTRTWSYETTPGKPQALISDYGCGGLSGGRTPELSHVHPATLEWLTDNGLFKPEGGGARSAMLYRVRQGVSQSAADLCERTGLYHTTWLNPPKPAADTKALTPATPEPAAVDLTAKQILLLAELADFRWRWPAGEHLAAGPHGGAHGLDKTLPAFVVLVGPDGRQGFSLTQAGVKVLEKLGLGRLTHVDGTTPPNAREGMLRQVRETVINPAKAADMVDGEYVTPWLNTVPAITLAKKTRDAAAGRQRIVEFGTIVNDIMAPFTSRVHGVVGMAASKRDWSGEPAVDPREIPELADLVVSELMSANPYVACGHLAMIQLKVARAGYSTIAADAAVTEAVKRWKASQARDDALLSLKVGDVVNTGGATDYRLISRKERQDSRVFDFIVQPILNGKDYGGERALSLSEIRSLAGPNELSPQSIKLAREATEAAAEVEAHPGPPPEVEAGDDLERDAVNEDEYRGWIADALATNHQVDPEAAPGFSIDAFDKQVGNGVGIKFLATPGTWRRADAAFDAADWAAENLAGGQLVEPEQSQTEGEETHAA